MAARSRLATLDDAYAAAVGLLARRSRTTAELAAELSARGASPPDVDAVVARLKAHRHLDDAELAHDQAFALLDGKGYSPSLAVEALERRGVLPADARAAVEAVREGRSERELCERALRKRTGRLRLDPAKAGREARALARLGHDAEIVARVLEQASGAPKGHSSDD
jgi:SOS response regulatory protein OraA/RecX